MIYAVEYIKIDLELRLKRPLNHFSKAFSLKGVPIWSKCTKKHDPPRNFRELEALKLVLKNLFLNNSLFAKFPDFRRSLAGFWRLGMESQTGLLF